MGDQLICLIIKEDFGEQFSQVVGLLLKHGELALADIVTESKLSFEEIKQILIILIKHNIVVFTAKSNPMGEEKKEGQTDLNDDFVYKVSVGDVIHRLRFARFLRHIGTIYGTLHQSILEDFIENGRLTLQDCIDETNEHIKAGTCDHYTEQEIIDAVATLIKGQYLVRVDMSNYSKDLFEASMTIAQHKPELGVTKGGKRKAATPMKEAKTKKGKKTKDPIADSITHLASDGLTQDVVARLGQIPGKDKIALPNFKVDLLNKNKMEPEEQKEVYTKTHPLFYDSSVNENHMFRINFRKFIHDFRTQHIVEAIKNKINVQAAIIVQVMLANSNLFSRASNFKITEDYLLGDIVAKLSKYPVLNESSVEKYLELLEKDQFVKKVSGTGKSILPTYAINMVSLIEKLQIKSLERIIEEKYSQKHSRIFRLLDAMGYLDEKQISDNCMIPLKEARSHIMQLIAMRMVESQELPGDKGKSIIVYGLRPKQALSNLVEDMFKTIFNLKKRSVVEYERLHELIDTNASEEQIEKTRALITKCESAILELDESIMLFDEY